MDTSPPVGMSDYDRYLHLACAIVHHSLLSSDLGHHMHQRGIKLLLHHVS